MAHAPARRDPTDRTGALALTESLTGSVERITFQNDETGFCVLQVKARGYRRPVTLVGHAAAVALGELVTAEGAFVHDRHHGVQFQATSLKTSAPTSAEDLQRYLGSGLIRGIGPVSAQRLIASFGTEVLDIIERAPHQLARVHGIGLGKAQQIAESWAEHQALRTIAAFLKEHRIGNGLLMRIYRAYGRDAIAAITENPYRLVLDIPGFAFAEADRVAAHLGLEPRASIRLQAGLASALASAVEDGHCGLPRDELLRRAGDLLELPLGELRPVLDEECRLRRLVADRVDEEPCIFLRSLYGAELFIATRLKDLARGVLPWGDVDTGEAVRGAEALVGLTLSASQREALGQACRSKVTVITGGPGVGKTTLVRALLALLTDRSVSVTLCAPTGRAAKRLSESTGLAAQTIHRLLEASAGGFRRNPTAPLVTDLVVVDEVSMVDVKLMTALLRAVPDHAALLLIGDVDQLPSIGPGQVLADVIAAGTVPVVHLTEVFRQQAQSRIIAAAHAINRGDVPDLEPVPDSDFYFVEANDPADVTAKLLTLVRRRIPTRFGLDPVRDIQVLCPVNRGPLGAYGLNGELQRLLNPPGEASLAHAGRTFGAGDKVMQVRNDYDREVYNGEIGLVRQVDVEAGEMTVAFDERVICYTRRDLDELALAYATTVHKAQGSEYPAVILPVLRQHGSMLRRNLLYTGVTRGSRLVVLLGSRAALAAAVTAKDDRRRWSRLRTWLSTDTPPQP
ncbi:MAG TPA: ATP-dependent RecD-like DNA helicase [Microvirga sp.]|jgi:exodeoxyribonuclease V alpha subunit